MSAPFRPVFALPLLAALLLVSAARAQIALSPVALPAPGFDQPDLLPAIESEIQQKAYTDAVTNIDALLHDHSEELMSVDSGGLLSVAAWVDRLSPDQCAAIAPDYRAKFDPAAKDLLDAVRRNPARRPVEFYAIVRRYPLGLTAPFALALAADRSLELGDQDAADILFSLAQLRGWTPDATHAQQIDALRRLAADKPPASFHGPFPCEASWLDNPLAYNTPRIFPLAFDDRLFIQGPRQLICFLPTGQPLWRFPPTPGQSQAPPRIPPDRQDPTRAPVYVPAVLTDLTSAPQLVISTQPSSNNQQNAYRLVCLRASDAKLLWSSDDQDQFRSLTFVSAPAISGRFTYALALAPWPPVSDQTALQAVAVETMTGQLIWQTPLAHFAVTPAWRTRFANRNPWTDQFNQSPPGVAADVLMVSPGIGAVAALDRFDGSIRWLRPYAAIDPDPDRDRSPDAMRRQTDLLRDLRRQRTHSGSDTPPRTPLDAWLWQRFSSTPCLCRNIVIAAPQDTMSAFAFDAADGKPLWTNPSLDAPTLIGPAAGLAIFAGPSLQALAPRDGSIVWHWEGRPPGPTGPAVIQDSTILIPNLNAAAMLTALSAATGAIVPPPPLSPLRRVFASEPGKKALDDAGALKSLEPPPGP